MPHRSKDVASRLRAGGGTRALRLGWLVAVGIEIVLAWVKITLSIEDHGLQSELRRCVVFEPRLGVPCLHHVGDVAIDLDGMGAKRSLQRTSRCTIAGIVGLSVLDVGLCDLEPQRLM